MKTGRNEPCPCGSGKKYKHCCLAAANAAPEPPDEITWRRMRRLLDEWQRDMLRFVTNVYGRDAIEEAWSEFLLDDKTPFDPESIHLQVFLSWLYHFWSPDEIETRVRDKALHDAIPTAEFLRRKRSLDPLLRQYLESCLAAPMSVFEVLRADPGRSLTLHDILTGEEHEVTERSASATMDEGDLIFGQVAQAGGMALLDTCQGFAMPPIWKVEVINFRQRQFQGAATVARQTLRECDLELLGLYHAIARRILEPELPVLQNTDGEALSLRKVVYDVPSAQEAFDALKHLALDDSDDELLRNAARDKQGRLVSVQFSWLKRGDERNPGWENTLLGSIEIDGTRLTAEVNSKEREKALRAIVGKALGERARYRATRIQSAKRLLSQARAAGAHQEEKDSLAELPEVKAKIAEMMEKHYAAWVNEKIPALRGRTPLEAVADPAGREAVGALVRQIERDGERMAPPLDPAIVRRLRERLGLS